MYICILDRTNYQTYYFMENKNLKKPFFASFLENQLKDTKNVKGGASGSGATSKLLDSVTKPESDMEQTMKYPSDNDEISIPVEL